MPNSPNRSMPAPPKGRRKKGEEGTQLLRDIRVLAGSLTKRENTRTEKTHLTNTRSKKRPTNQQAKEGLSHRQAQPATAHGKNTSTRASMTVPST